MLSFVSKRSWTMQLKNFWKPLLEICLFGSKKNMNYQIKSNLNLPWIYLVHINHFYTPEIKHVIRGNVCSGKYHLGNCPLGKCPLWELPVLGTALPGNVCRGSFHQWNVFGELSVREKSFGERSVGKCPSGNCPDTIRNVIKQCFKNYS